VPATTIFPSGWMARSDGRSVWSGSTSATPRPFEPNPLSRAPLCGTTTNGAVVETLTLPLLTTIGAVTAPSGTIAVICVLESIEPAADRFPNFTPWTELKPSPWIVTAVPTSPLVGENDVIARGTVKLPALVPVPATVVTATFPVVAP